MQNAKMLNTISNFTEKGLKKVVFFYLKFRVRSRLTAVVIAYELNSDHWLNDIRPTTRQQYTRIRTRFSKKSYSY